MNIIEALQEAYKEKQWVRPIRWRGEGRALCFKESKRLFFYNQEKINIALMPVIDDICGEWEIVSPESIKAETVDSQLDIPF